VANVLAPVCRDELGPVLRRIFVSLEREDELPQLGTLGHDDDGDGSPSGAAGAQSSPGMTSQDDTAVDPMSEPYALPDLDQQPLALPRHGDKGALRSFTSLTSRQITMTFAKPKNNKKKRRSLGSSRKVRGGAGHRSDDASSSNPRGVGGKKPKSSVVVMETPAKELENQHAAAVLAGVKRGRRTQVVQESPAVAKQREALATESGRMTTTLSSTAAAGATGAPTLGVDEAGGARRSPRVRLHGAAAASATARGRGASSSASSAPRSLHMSDDGDLVASASPGHAGGAAGMRPSPRRSPRVSAATAAASALGVNDDGDSRRGVKRALDL
jgi:hypothetical protein